MSTARVERRLSAILAADVAGYSRLTGQDEEDTHAQLQDHLCCLVDPKIAEYRGRVVKNTGDGLLAEFSSVVEALRCALEVQRGMAKRNADVPSDRRIEFRIGINVGDIMVDHGDIFGDGVNVAARLEGLAEPGGICVSARVQEDAVGKLGVSFQDVGEQQLKNINRPVHVYRIEPGCPARTQTASLRLVDKPLVAAGDGSWSAISVQRIRMALLILLLLFVTGAGLGYWYFGPRPLQPLAHRLSIIVLPFTNLSNEPEQEYFAEAVADDLTTDLSRIEDSFVIAPSTAKAYKGMDPRRVGSELGVRYVLDGSLRRTESRVRVSVLLIDARTGAQIWSERFDSDWSKSMQLQDLITGQLARRLDLELINQESRDAEFARPNNPSAVDLAMRGWAVLNQPYSHEQLAQARTFFERALQIDPALPKALIGLADTLAMDVNFRWSDAPADHLRRADDAIGRALSVVPNNAMAHFVKGEIQRARGRNLEAVGEYEAATSINSSFAPAYGGFGSVQIRLGRSTEAFAPLQMAIRLSPRDPLLNTWYFYICHAHTHLGQYDAAIDWCRRSVAVQPFWIAFVDLAAANALLGRESQAQEAVSELRKLRPDYTVARWMQDGKGWSDNPVFLAEFQRIADGLRKAGLPN